MTASTDGTTFPGQDADPIANTASARSDDGAIPPPAVRAHPISGSSPALPLIKANPALSPGVRVVEPPDALSQNAHSHDALLPEADGTNAQTLSPADPKRESDEGQPYLDDANPYGRPLANRQNRPMGGIGTAIDPSEEERSHDRTEAPVS